MSLVAAALDAVRRAHPWHHGRFAGLSWRWRDTGGIGQPLVLLPGALGTADIFVHQLRSLAPARRVVAIDYPAGTMEQLADGLADLIPSALGPPRVDALGASFGGRWLQDAAARFPGRFRRLILANTFANSDSVARHPLFDVARIRSQTPEAVKAVWITRLSSQAPSPLRDLQLALLDEQAAATLHDRLLSVATAVPAPSIADGERCAIIECDDDPLIPAETQADLRARLPNARVIRFSDGGHYPHVVIPSDYGRAVTHSWPCRTDRSWRTPRRPCRLAPVLASRRRV